MEPTVISNYKKPLPPQLVKISKLVKLMDTAFTIPFTNIKFGLDPIIGLFPIIGPIIDYGISAYLLLGLLKNGASGKVVMKMLGNITVDGLVGAIPILGKLIDVFYKANRRNLVLAVEHFEEGKHDGSAKPYIIAFLSFFTLFFVGLAFLSFYVFQYLWHWLNAPSVF